MDYQKAAGRKGPRPAVRIGACQDLIGLCELYLSDPENADVSDRFLEECLRVLRKKVYYYVVYQRNCPRFLAPDTFAQDVFNLAVVKFWAGFRRLRHPARLNTWLSRVASSAVFDELRGFTRRTKDGPCEWETIHAAGFREEANILDEERNRPSAERDDAPHCVVDVNQLVYADILDKVFRDNGDGHKHEELDWLVLKLRVDFTVDEIAEQLGKAKATIQYLLKRSKRRFRIIAESRHKFTASDL
jgi:RNA polymerase sigma factor (sigma-70 family)